MIKYLLLSLCLITASCSKKENQLKVAASAIPHAQLLEQAKPVLKQEGIDLEIIVIDDYNIPNRALAEGEVQANFFQHIPFMEQQIKAFHYPIESIAKIEIEPMGVYSKKITSIDALREKAVIAIPNDPSNEARALILLHHHQVIQLDDPQNFQATVLNIVKNPKNLQFKEVDTSMLPRTLSDVDAAAIPTNFALQANLSPLTDALIRESKDSPYANVIVIRIDEKGDPKIEALKKAMTSDQMRLYIEKTYHGAIIPAF